MKSKTLLTILATTFLALTSYSIDGPIDNYARAQQTQNASSENSDSINYTKIREITRKRSGYETVKIEYGLESKVWQSLKSGMSKQEFYNSVKQAPIELKTTTIFRGIIRIRGYINNDDIKGEFLREADRFIKNKPSQYDPGLKFSREDKAVLKEILDRELKSNLTETIKPWFASAKKVYLYPPKSQILVRTDREGYPSFEILINMNEPTDETPSYKTLLITKIVDEKERDVFNKFLLHSILINDFYAEYLEASKTG
jgi:hypothetical protein